MGAGVSERLGLSPPQRASSSARALRDRASGRPPGGRFWAQALLCSQLLRRALAAPASQRTAAAGGCARPSRRPSGSLSRQSAPGTGAPQLSQPQPLAIFQHLPRGKGTCHGPRSTYRPAPPGYQSSPARHGWPTAPTLQLLDILCLNTTGSRVMLWAHMCPNPGCGL